MMRCLACHNLMTAMHMLYCEKGVSYTDVMEILSNAEEEDDNDD